MKLPEEHRREVRFWRKDTQDFPGQETDILRGIEGRIDGTREVTLHELGCSRGKNLKAIRKRYKNVRVSGNDVSVWAFRESVRDPLMDSTVIQEDTVEFLVRQPDGAFDYVLTSAHLEHISNSVDGILQEHIPRVVKRKLFILEPDSVGDKYGDGKHHKFGREYRGFFPGMEVEDVLPSKHADHYSFFVFRKTGR